MNPPFRVLIADDEPLARAGIRAFLEGAEDMTIAGESGNGPDTVDAVLRLHPDLLFLDIQMPGHDGFGVIGAISPERMPVTVFVTAYDEHALRAFQVHAIDYLLKPVRADRFAIALDRARALLHAGAESGIVGQLRAMLDGRNARYLQRLVIRSTGRIDVVQTADVDWLAADGDYVRVHTPAKTYIMREKIGTLEERLDPALFVRIHRSTIVRLDCIRQLEPHFNGDHTVLLAGGQKFSLSRSYRDRVMTSIASATDHRTPDPP